MDLPEVGERKATQRRFAPKVRTGRTHIVEMMPAMLILIAKDA